LTITQTETKFLNELVLDCITYRLSKEEALEYIKTRFKRISESSYKQRKAHALSNNSAQLWLNNFTRIGFVIAHKQQIESIEKLQEDSLKQFYIEITKEQQDRDEDKIKGLKEDIRSNVKLLSELNLGTPIISAIKSKIQDAEAIQVRE
jgi:hypothetical protein